MCTSKPKAPKLPPPPPPPQEVQAPDAINKRRRNQNTGGFASVPGSTLLTGPSGAGVATTGASTLLGG